MKRPALVMAVLLVLLAGCNSAAPLKHGRDLSAKDPEWVERQLGPGFSYRWDVFVAKGDTMSWDWFVDEETPVKFSVYEFSSAGTITHGQKTDWQDTGDFVIERAGRHALAWTNNGDATATLWMRVTPELYDDALLSPGTDPGDGGCRRLLC